jgi:hypothetical protein
MLEEATPRERFHPPSRNAGADIFAGVHTSAVGFAITDNGDSWTPVDNGLGCGNVWSLGINPSGDSFAGTAGYGDGMYRSTDNRDSWNLANTGLTSTDVVALAINVSNSHIFARTQSQNG